MCQLGQTCPGAQISKPDIRTSLQGFRKKRGHD